MTLQKIVLLMFIAGGCSQQTIDSGKRMNVAAIDSQSNGDQTSEIAPGEKSTSGSNNSTSDRGLKMVPLPNSELQLPPKPESAQSQQNSQTHETEPTFEVEVEVPQEPVPSEPSTDFDQTEPFEPTMTPTQTPVHVQTPFPTQIPTQAQTPFPTQIPTQVQTPFPTQIPTQVQTPVPTQIPTQVQTPVPTQIPTQVQTPIPTQIPTQVQTPVPTNTPVPANTTLDSASAARIDAIVDNVMRTSGATAISVAIAKDGRIVFAKGFGSANESSRFRIASISKPITAAAIMKLVETGRLTLDSKVFGPGSVLGDAYGTIRPYRPYVTAITVRHLLTHTVGGWINDGYDPMFSNPTLSASQLITWTIDNRTLSTPPGTSYGYSNFGYNILGRVIEKVSGQTYERYVQDNILAPAGISRMMIGGDTAAQRQSDEVFYKESNPNAPYEMKVARMDAHGGWIATAMDLVRFGLRIDGFSSKPDVLSASSINQMMTGTSVNPNYGFGVSVNSSNHFWHTGLLPGLSSIFVRLSSGYVWSALANTREGNINLDTMMWNIVNTVTAWPDIDLETQSNVVAQQQTPAPANAGCVAHNGAIFPHGQAYEYQYYDSASVCTYTHTYGICNNGSYPTYWRNESCAPKNRAPVLQQIPCTIGALGYGQSGTCQMAASDPDGDAITWWKTLDDTCYGGGSVAWSSASANGVMTLTLPWSGHGSCRASFWACDNKGLCSAQWNGYFNW